MTSRFTQVDVFSAEPFAGNPVAVVHDADDLDTATMQRFAHWMNLSETTFLLSPTHAEADYRVRIFTPTEELPFAGHPTLGTCHAWLEAGGQPTSMSQVVQECEAGLIAIRQSERLAFAAPPQVRSGPVDDADLERICAALDVGRDEIVDSQWVDNGPGWVAVLLADADRVLALNPSYSDLDIGVVGLWESSTGGSSRPDPAIEVRAFFPKNGSVVEDPVTGSLNASVAQWLLTNGTLTAPYVASQGRALGRAGRVHIGQEGTTVWVGGATTTCVTGTVELS